MATNLDRPIPTFDYRRTLPEIEEEIVESFRRVLHSGRLILGPETEAFESELAAWVGAAHCVGVSSGTTALHLAFLALGIGAGDEVVTVANTCAPTAAAIRLTGAKPVFVEVRDEDLTMDPRALEAALTERTRAIVPVHLWGHAAAVDQIVEIAGRNGVAVVEDCAQAQGTRLYERHVGTFGDFGCFSFYPTKNLGAFGDAGAVITDDPSLARRLRSLRMYGYDEQATSLEPGMNARISEVQAAILRVRLRRLSAHLARRRGLAALYDRGLAGEPVLRRPMERPEVEISYHQYVVRSPSRDDLAASLARAGVGTGIHYPVPLHRMPAYVDDAQPPLPITERAAGEILSLPICDGLEEAEVERAVSVIRRVTGAAT